jgi:hypothetical protein
MTFLKNFTDFHGLSFVSDVFIETGTFNGDTLEAAIGAGFKDLHSIDVVEEYTEKAKAKFVEFKNVFLHCGSSPEILPRIIDPSRSTTFWLDAHYQAYKENEIDLKYGECPLVEELKVVFSNNWVFPPIVLIDDAHMFECARPCFKAEDWPSLEVIQSLLPEGYQLKKLDDILVAIYS